MTKKCRSSPTPAFCPRPTCYLVTRYQDDELYKLLVLCRPKFGAHQAAQPSTAHRGRCVESSKRLVTVQMDLILFLQDSTQRQTAIKSKFRHLSQVGHSSIQ